MSEQPRNYYGKNYVLATSSTPKHKANAYDLFVANTAADDLKGYGTVVHPDGTRKIVNDKEAYFAIYPEARASTAAGLADFRARYGKKQAELRAEEDKKREGEREEDVEMVGMGLHGCAKGQKPITCGACAGNGHIRGLADIERECKDCEGKGFTMTPCKQCAEEKAREKGKYKGSCFNGSRSIGAVPRVMLSGD